MNSSVLKVIDTVPIKYCRQKILQVNKAIQPRDQELIEDSYLTSAILIDLEGSNAHDNYKCHNNKV